MRKNELIKPEIQKEIIEKYLSKISVKKLCEEYNVCDVTIYNILKRNNIKQRNGSVVYPLKNENYFDCINTPEKAYLVGLIGADGCITSDKAQVVISLQEKDRDILDKYSKIILGVSNVKIMPPREKGRQNYAVFSFCSKRLVEKLADFGIKPKKSFNCDSNIESLNEELFKAYLLGLNDGDGSIYMYRKNQRPNSLVFALICSVALCYKIHKKLKQYLDLDIPIHVKKTPGGELRYLRISKREYCLKLLNWLYSSNIDCLDRKKQVYLKFKDDCSNYRKNRGLISKYPYITLDNRNPRPRWKAQIPITGTKKLYIGQYDTEEEAYQAQQKYIQTHNVNL